MMADRTRRFWESVFRAGDNVVREEGGGCISGNCSPVWSNSVPKELNQSPVAVDISANIDRILVAHLIRFSECNEYKLRGEKSNKHSCCLQRVRTVNQETGLAYYSMLIEVKLTL